jgi:hypothetical protein
MKEIIIDGVEYTLTPTELYKEMCEKIKKSAEDSCIDCTPAEKHGRFVPKFGEEYWSIGATIEDDYIAQDTFYNDSLNRERIILGNVYPTKEVAEKALAQKQALQRIYEYMDKKGLWYEPDWSDGEPKWQIAGWDYEDNMPRIDFYADIDMSQHHLIFRTIEDRQKVLDNCAKDLEILLKNY